MKSDSIKYAIDGNCEIKYSAKIVKFDKTIVDMGATELKWDLHKILDKIENEQLLRTVYDFLKQSENVENVQLWKTLTEEQKKEIYLSYEESQDDRKLIDWETVKKKY